VTSKNKQYNNIVASNKVFAQRIAQAKKKTIVKPPIVHQNFLQKIGSGISNFFNTPKQPLNTVGTGIGKAGLTRLPVKSTSPSVAVGRTGVKIQPRAYSSADALITGALDSASLGIVNGGLNKLTGNKGDMSVKGHETAYGVGKLLGYALPYGAASKAIKPLVGAIKNPLLRGAARVAEGSSVFTGGGAIEDLANRRSKAEIIKNAKTNALIGGGFGLVGEAIPAIAKGIKNLKARPQNIQNAFNSKFGEMPSNARIAQPQGLKGSFKRPQTPNTIAETRFNNTQSKLKTLMGGKTPLKPITSNLKPLGTNIPIVNKLPTKIPKNDMTSVAMSSKAPNQQSQTIKSPFETNKPKYVAPVDANGNPLPDPKIVSSRKADKTTLGQKFNKFYTATVDKNKSISDFSKVAKDKTYTLATNSANQKNIADYIMTDNMVNKQGEVIGKSLKAVLKDIPKEADSEFMNYALEKHNIARAGEGKPIFPNRTSEQSASKVAEIEKLHPEWKAKTKEVTKWIDDFMNEWGVKAGTLDENLSKINRKTYPDYIPTNRDFSTLEQAGQGFGGSGKGFVNQTTPIKRATGSARNIIDPRENIANMVVRTIKTAKNNEVGQNLVDSIRSNPTTLGKYAEIVGEPKGNVSNIVRVLEKGKPVYVKINDLGLLKAMENLNKTDVGNVEAVAKKATNIFKQLITQKNPVFALRNIARDVPTAYVNGSVANPLKFGMNLLKAGKEVATNSKGFQQYKALGGGGANFFDSGNASKSIKELVGNDNFLLKGLKAIPKGIEKFNNLTESAPRFSEFKTVLKKTGSVEKAMFAANDITTNFSRGGDLAKHADSYVPYLNAGLQGLDKTVRQFKNKPIGTLLKGAVGITVPTLIFNNMNKDNENYQNLDNRTKDNYFLIPRKDGTFIKIPKSRELGVLFASLAERTLRAANGEKNPFKDYMGTVATNFAPADPISNNILAPLAYNIPSNKDFANRPIVPLSMVMDGRSPRYQYDEKTSVLAKKLGEIANLSPKKIDYVIKSYTGVIGQMGLPALTPTPDKSPLQNALKPITSQFVADSSYSNSAVNDFYNNMDKLKQIAADKNIGENIPSKTITNEEALRNQFTKASKEMTDINKKIKATSNEEYIKYYKQQIIEIAKKNNQNMR